MNKETNVSVFSKSQCELQEISKDLGKKFSQLVNFKKILFLKLLYLYPKKYIKLMLSFLKN